MTQKHRITPELLRELIAYDSQTGALTWLARPASMFTEERLWKAWNTRHAGKPALNCLGPEGYLQGQVLGINLLAHRVAFAIHYGRWPVFADHESGVKTDNRIKNLREVKTHQGNMRNMGQRHDNLSGFTGVSWDKRRKLWRATIRIDGKQVTLGRFANIDDAIECRKRANDEHGYHQNHGRRTAP